jgi:hypothetical protein
LVEDGGKFTYVYRKTIYRENAADPELAMPIDDGAVRTGSPETAMPGEDVVPVHIVNTCFGLAQMVPAQPSVLPARGEGESEPQLSGRAINVLKMLADEVIGEIPRCDDWVPPETLLRRITVERLSIARNCGPRTTDEIICWAEARGVTIQPMFHAGKSLSETWRELSARFAAGDLSKAELAEALEKSVRRKSTKIPVAVQQILLKYLKRLGEDIRRG